MEDLNIDDLLDEASELSSNKKNNINKNFGREVEDFEIKYEIIDSDNELVTAMKKAVNNAHIKKSELYSIVGRTEGYNLYYSLKKGVISWKRVETWCNIIGVQPMITFIKK